MLPRKRSEVPSGRPPWPVLLGRPAGEFDGAGRREQPARTSDEKMTVPPSIGHGRILQAGRGFPGLQGQRFRRGPVLLEHRPSPVVHDRVLALPEADPPAPGHLAVCLVQGGVKRTRHVHRLVLEAFLGPCPEGMECCHDDGRPENNRLDNLRWDTRRANVQDRSRHGTQRVGSTAHSKLREEDILEIRRLRSGGVPMNDLAVRYGVCRSNIEAIVYRRSWKHLP
jgi:hypothetical protein